MGLYTKGNEVLDWITAFQPLLTEQVLQVVQPLGLPGLLAAPVGGLLISLIHQAIEHKVAPYTPHSNDPEVRKLPPKEAREAFKNYKKSTDTSANR